MSNVYKCDRCGEIFEPMLLQSGEPFICRKSRENFDLCPECYEYLLNFLYNKCKCNTCKHMGKSLTKKPCKECCHAWEDMYEERKNE